MMYFAGRTNARPWQHYHQQHYHHERTATGPGIPHTKKAARSGRLFQWSDD